MFYENPHFNNLETWKTAVGERLKCKFESFQVKMVFTMLTLSQSDDLIRKELVGITLKHNFASSARILGFVN
jgi:hypothetical protein